MSRGGGVPLHQRCSSGQYCVTNKRLNPSLGFHRFPSDEGRCIKWVQATGNRLLFNFTHKQLIARALCSRHFAADQYKVHGNVHSGLKPTALPSIFAPNLPLPDSELPQQLLREFQGQTFVSKQSAPLCDVSNLVNGGSVKSSQNASGDGRKTLPHLSSNSRTLPSSVPLPASSCTPGPGDGSKSSIELSYSSSVDLDFISVPFSSTLSVSDVPSNKRSFSSLCDSSHDNTRVKRWRRLDFSEDSAPTRPSVPGPSTVTTSTPLPDISASKLSTPHLPIIDSGVFSPSTSFGPPLLSTPVKRKGRKRKRKSKPKPQAKSSGRATTFSTFGLTKHDITPRKSNILKDNKLLRRQISSLQRSLEAVKHNRKALIKLSNQPIVSKMRAILKTPEALHLFEAQVNNHKKNKHAFRYTLEQKTTALVLFKNSRKNYNILSKIMNLPSPSTLHALMRRVKFEVGANKHFFDHLGEVIKDFTPMQRACIVMWDETQVKKGLFYNEAKDRVEGYVDHGDGKEQRGVANKGLVFQVQSLSKKWKQPVAYYFSEDDTSPAILVKLIMTVITCLQDIGFDVRASVSDQGGSNRSAISQLRDRFTPEGSAPPKTIPLCDKCKKKKVIVSKANAQVNKRLKLGLSQKEAGDKMYFSRHTCRDCNIAAFNPAKITYYRINKDVNIYHFWDVPHLMKSLRTNFQNYNVEFAPGKLAKWAHIDQLYRQDGVGGTFYKVALKLTDAHLKACHNSDKMKVSMAAQVLSARVATALKKIDDWSEGKAIPGASDTSEFVYFADQLFDSMNGGAKVTGKPLRRNLSDDSPHFKFWEQAEEQLKNLWFKNAPRIFDSTKGWVENIYSFRGLWGDLKVLGFRYLNLRQCNQDGLENFFAVMKANGHKVPTVPQFISGLKTSVVTNLRNSGIRGANCEVDEGSLLTDLLVFFRAACTDESQSNVLFEPRISAEYELTAEELTEIDNLKSFFQPSAGEEDSVVDEADLFDALFPPVEPSSDSAALEELFEPICDSIGHVAPSEPICDSIDHVAPSEPICDKIDHVTGCVCWMDSVQIQPIRDVVTLQDAEGMAEAIKARQRKSKKVTAKKKSDEALAQQAIEEENRGWFGNRRKLTAYVTGFIVKKTMGRVKCEDCEHTLLSVEKTQDHELVVALEHDDKSRLTYAKPHVIDAIVKWVDIFIKVMHSDFHKPGLMMKLFGEFKVHANLVNVGCEKHEVEVQRFIMLYFCRVSIHHRCRQLNRFFAKCLQNKNSLNTVGVNRNNGKKGPSTSSQATATANEECPERFIEEMMDDPLSVLNPTITEGLTDEELNRLMEDMDY